MLENTKITNNLNEIPALTLKDVRKTYLLGDNSVHALKGVSVSFRKSEFVSILGPSGCGKTTMLNIIGGLDRYTSGDLLIDGISTKNYKERDWDTYRNHRIGFVFQSYNLIPHQTVLSNVELALTIGGVSKEEREVKARIALEKVGLKGEENKRPNQLSGGQCQRVAIARALVNEPDILLADEPTGALDSKTSIQIMELIKEISKDKLVIMVTHNGEIAEQYSTRIVSLKDGEIVGDTNPCNAFESADDLPNDEVLEKSPSKGIKKQKIKKQKRSKMSIWTSFKLSLRNLFTKKGRTALTSFAGSIGIIGISLILAVSQGTTAYINHVQETTLSSYPITLETEAIDVMSLMENFMNVANEDPGHPLDGVYKDPVIGELVNALASATSGTNDLASFKTYLESEIAKPNSSLSNAITGINYSYDFDLNIYTKYQDKIVKSDTGELMDEMISKYFAKKFGTGNLAGGATSGSSASSSPFASMMMGSGMWEKLLPARDGGTVNEIVKKQYDLIYGDWPTQANEVVLVVNEKNELDDLTLYAMGLIGQDEIDAIIDSAVAGTTLPSTTKKWTYQEICSEQKTFKTILPYDAYVKSGNVFVNLLDTPNGNGMDLLYDDGYELRVKGIIRPNPDSENHMLKGKIGYTYKLTEYILNGAENSDVVQAQKQTPDIDVLTGKPFKSNTETLTEKQKAQEFKTYVSKLDANGKKQVYIKVKSVMNVIELAQEISKRFGELPDKTAKIDKIATLYATQMGQLVDKTVIAKFLESMTDEQIDKLLKEIVLPLEIQTEYAKKQAMTYGPKPAEELASQLGDDIENIYTVKDLAKYYDRVTEFSNSSYEENLKKFGLISLGTPKSISIYASSFENKDLIIAAIDSYNKSVGATKEIKYTDYVGLLMSSITTIIDAITYILIAFVAISLVVSSIMIAVITLISVQERTKEIGILRSIGASKRDVSGLFNAETFIIGLMAGLMGIGVTYLLCIPINLILRALTGIPTLKAILPVGAAAILVGISVLLNVISGIIPSRSAAKKDPVIALRTE